MSKLASLAAALALAASVAQAAPTYSAVYAFGDSLSDAGNLFTFSSQPGSPLPPQPVSPYSAGRFSNGPTWVQDLTVSLGLGVLGPSLLGGNDFAYGGARTGATPLYAAQAIDLGSQLAQFGTAHATAPSSALYTLTIGANDVFAAARAYTLGAPLASVQAAVATAAQNAATFIGALKTAGAKSVLLYNVPDLGLTPIAREAGAAFQGLVTSLANAFNLALQADLVPARDTGLQLFTLDEFTKVRQVVANPSTYGFTNVTSRCWTGTYTDPASGTLCSPTTAGQDAYLFFDGLHPTEAGHAQVAADALILLVPEPASMALLLVGVGAVAVARRRAA